MLGLITDRSQRNVYRNKELTSKGWANMTTEERAEWMGDPLATVGANLFTTGTYYSSSVELKYRNTELVAQAIYGGVYLYAISILGKASDYENKVFTLSAENFDAPTAATPKLEVFWHNADGFDYAGGTLLTAGSVTFDTTDYPNTNNREYLAIYVYLTTHGEVATGDTVRFSQVMLESGSVRHEYVPYTDILPTLATKGAYNYSDLNRVERAVAEIADRAGLNLTTKQNWGMWEIPTDTDMSRYLGNVQAIKDNWAINISLPASMNNFTYEHANNIELILNKAYELLGA